MFYAEVIEKIKTDILYSVIFFLENRAVYEIMWKNYGTARQAKDYNIIRRICTACWITNATDIECRVCNTYCVSMTKMVMRTLLNITFKRILPFLLVSFFIPCRGTSILFDACVE